MIDFKSKFGRFARKIVQGEYFIWLTTVDSKGTPQPRPVWFIWENDSFLIYSQAKAFKLKHIRKNAQVALHFNTADALGESDSSSFQERQGSIKKPSQQTKAAPI